MGEDRGGGRRGGREGEEEEDKLGSRGLGEGRGVKGEWGQGDRGQGSLWSHALHDFVQPCTS